MSATSSDDEEFDVTLVTQFFHPDSSANSTILTDLATGLSDRGAKVNVITADPSYTPDDRAATVPKRESFGGVQITRVFATRFDRQRGIQWRLLNELTFLISAAFHLVFRTGEDDVLLLPTAPSFLPILGWILGRMFGRSYVPVVMDLYPDMAVELDYLSQASPVFSLWDSLNSRTYRKADRVVTIGETMEETLIEKYGEECNTVVIHNWEDGEFITPQEKSDNPFAEEHNLVDRMTVLYSGNLGIHHDLESVVEAGDRLEADYGAEELALLFIGEGGRKPLLKDMKVERSLETVSFLPYQPREILPDSLTCGDVALVTMRAGVEGLCVSSKFYTALASGQAVLAITSPDSEIGRIVERTEVGIRVDPDSPDQVVEAISFWLENPDAVDRMAKKSRELFEAEYRMDSSVDNYFDVLESVASSQR